MPDAAPPRAPILRPIRRLGLVGRLLSLARVDFPRTRPAPTAVRLAAATAVSVVGSLAADALLVVVGEAIFPSTKGYVHFRFSDYGKLTVIGVLVACAAWPVICRISSAAKWLFVRMAVLVTVVLLIPDLLILAQGQPAKAVVILMIMHLAIAVVTYNVLARLAPPRRR